MKMLQNELPGGLKWFERVMRMDQNVWPKKMFQGTPLGRTKEKQDQKNSRNENIRLEIRKINRKMP